MATQAEVRERIARIRRAVLPAECTEQDLAAALEVSRRTVQRLGLPYRRIGHRRYCDIQASARVLHGLPPSSATPAAKAQAGA